VIECTIVTDKLEVKKAAFLRAELTKIKHTAFLLLAKTLSRYYQVLFVPVMLANFIV
jgi:hypothetical protein